MRKAIGMLSILLAVSGCERAADTKKTPPKAEREVQAPAAQPATKDTPPTKSRPTGLAAELKAIASGIWVGDFGKLDFSTPGILSYELKQCGYAEGDPPALKLADCKTVSGSGAVSFSDYAIEIPVAQDSLSGRLTLGAFISPQGKLHLGPGQVTRLAADRTGRLSFFARHDLELGSPDCLVRNIDTNKTYPTTCTWTARTGYELLRFHAAFDGMKMDRTFAYLAKPRLLVASQLILMSFSKK